MKYKVNVPKRVIPAEERLFDLVAMKIVFDTKLVNVVYQNTNEEGRNTPGDNIMVMFDEILSNLTKEETEAVSKFINITVALAWKRPIDEVKLEIPFLKNDPA